MQIAGHCSILAGVFIKAQSSIFNDCMCDKTNGGDVCMIRV